MLVESSDSDLLQTQGSPLGLKPPLAGVGHSRWLGRFDSISSFASSGLNGGPLSPKPQDDLFLSGHCAICDRPTRFRLGVEHYHEPWGYFFREGLTCEHCTLNSRMRAALDYTFSLVEPLQAPDIYLTEQITALYDCVKRRYPQTVGSEFLTEVLQGQLGDDGVRCEDLQALTFEDASFDVVLSLDVLEHVPDHHLALSEMRRVLRPGGALILTVPFIMSLDETIIQARMLPDGNIEHLQMPPEYHGNPLGPPSLSFRTFGWDLLGDMKAAGFAEAFVVPYKCGDFGYFEGPYPLVTAWA